ncbi:RNA-directed DNA polymerase [Polynucleobacter wuianus]|uniref:retron Ec67 family RNA-directed DNA polymerase/endonuclease n=1 Tax=Polynucleobacter wuianus TaxID=1743168 RepID=UPI001C0CAB59|nr:retron Ec67 family RNA-directed DNA polymerase/endonuclease [Polynucleobacter wuianus]MBU3610653.1 RNA-directed DNA polymerase [Polynucleobacter wuianus]
MSILEKLQAAQNLHDVALLLGYQPKSLSYILYVKPKTQKYTTFNIPKSSGGTREIKAPYPDLKTLQKRLSKLLQECIAEINLQKEITTSVSHGFRKKHSILTNAAVHKNMRYVLNLDLKDFFHSINFGRVRGFFIANQNFLLNPNVATIIAQIACHENCLPQGSPCSPVISNLVGHILDMRLVQLARKFGCIYSRYADDITFSTNKKVFPVDLATAALDGEQLWSVSKPLHDIIKRSGFDVNSAKTRMQYKFSRQEVTGLIVNSRVNVRFGYRRIARAMLHKLITRGEFHKPNSKKVSSVTNTTAPSLDYLNGVLSFINSVNLFVHKKHSFRVKSDSKKALEKSFLNLSISRGYRNFLLYKYFFAAKNPVIICEGKTDNVYIRSATRQLSTQYPILGKSSPDGTINLKISFFKRTKTTDMFLGLTGGASQFNKFIEDLRQPIFKDFLLKIKQPIIIVIDNDHEALKVFSYLYKNFNINCDKTVGFIEVFRGLYVIPIPLLSGANQSVIEELFDIKDLTRSLDGKKFNYKSDSYNTKLEYGKSAFATRIVQAKEDQIIFDGFKPLLTQIEEAIKSFRC